MLFHDISITDALVNLIVLWLSLSVHEWAHARMAFQLGDDTAARLGRMTINPLAHIDPIGTLLLPLLGVPFGWAKPVPVQPLCFYPRVNMRKGMMYVAIAGPISNVCLAAIFLALLAVLVRIAMIVPLPFDARAITAILRLVVQMILLNVVLAVFNLLPIPPLDGSRVADALMPRGLRPAWEQFCRVGPIAFAAVIILPQVAHVNLFAWPMEMTLLLIRAVVPVPGG
jgi:Zn-dependent protease